MVSKKWSILGHEWKDHVITGFLSGIIGIAIVYLIQVKFYHMDQLGEFGMSLRIPFLKRALLGALFVFLCFNYFDKLYAMRGVLISLILVGIYLAYLMFFS